MNSQPLRLVDRLRRCLQNKTDEPAWAEFLSYVDGIIGPPITALLKRWMASHSNGSSGVSLMEEVEDLKQMVWLNMIKRDCCALRHFKSHSDRSLQVYLIKIAITTALAYLEQVDVKVRYRATDSLNEIRAKGLGPIHRVSRGDRQSELAVLLCEMESIVCGHSRKGAADRDLMIFRLWLHGRSPSEIRQCLSLAISARAVRKIVAKQKNTLTTRLGRFTS